MITDCVNFADGFHLQQTNSLSVCVSNDVTFLYYTSCHHWSGQANSPDYFVAGTTHRGPPAVLRRMLRCLEDGAAVLHRRGLHRLLVLGHDGTRLVWAKTIREIRVSDPRWSRRWSWSTCCCSSRLGAWARDTEVICLKKLRKTFYKRGANICKTFSLPPDVCCDKCMRHASADAHVLTFNKNLLAQPPLDAAGVLFFTHQQEQKLTIWFVCCLGLGKWRSWLKAVGRKWLIRKRCTHTHHSVTMVTTQWTSWLDISSHGCFH